MAEIFNREEFSTAKKLVYMRHFYSQETIKADNATNQYIENRIPSLKIGVVAIGALLFVGASFLLVRSIRKRIH